LDKPAQHVERRRARDETGIGIDCEEGPVAGGAGSDDLALDVAGYGIELSQDGSEAPTLFVLIVLDIVDDDGPGRSRAEVTV